MKGLELAQEYYESYGKDMIDDEWAHLKNRICVGLVGEGSECFGFDDEVSQDHDFGVAFCMWLNDDDFDKYGKKLQSSYDQLPDKFLGYPKRVPTANSQNRIGVLNISSFYKSIIGIADIPTEKKIWLAINENMLATVTNGRVFFDPCGEFSRIRSALSYYPHEVRLVKLSRELALMSQAGQYNMIRAIKRKDYYCAKICLNQFIESALNMLYILNRKYVPFYKWKLRGLDDLCILQDVKQHILDLLASNYSDENTVDIVEKICERILIELKNQNFTDKRDDFLWNHVPYLK